MAVEAQILRPSDQLHDFLEAPNSGFGQTRLVCLTLSVDAPQKQTNY